MVSYFGYQKELLGRVDYTGGIAYSTPSASPALIGIGYIIGPRLSAINFSGGVIAWLVLIPLVLFIDPDLPHRIGATTGGTAPWDLASYTVWYNVVRPIAVGAMLVGAVYTLYSMRESILTSIRGAFHASAAGGEHAPRARGWISTSPSNGSSSPLRALSFRLRSSTNTSRTVGAQPSRRLL